MTYPTKAERDAARKVVEQIAAHGATVLGKLAHNGVCRETLNALDVVANVLGRDPDMFFKALVVEWSPEAPEMEKE